jgi:hypothetical protein
MLFCFSYGILKSSKYTEEENMNPSKINRAIFTFLASVVIVNITCIGALAADTRKYPDVSASAWYYDAVSYCTDAKLMSGNSDKLFYPNANATRAMTVTTLYQIEGKPMMGNGKSGTFIDVPEYMWYTDAVEWSASEELVMGYGDVTFGQDNEITREQLVTILYRYALYKGHDVSVPEGMKLSDFIDASDISKYAVSAMQWAVANGIFIGRTTDVLNPKDAATRAELATVLIRFDTKY